jgi:hypothetical protein
LTSASTTWVECVGCGLDSGKVVAPFGLAHLVTIGPGLPLDELSDDVGMTRVLGGLGDGPLI